MELRQEFAIAGNSIFFDQQLVDMSIAKILLTKEYTHSYHMWKIIAFDNNTWVRFKSHFRELDLDR